MLSDDPELKTWYLGQALHVLCPSPFKFRLTNDQCFTGGRDMLGSDLGHAYNIDVDASRAMKA